jgi:hypothetical protein
VYTIDSTYTLFLLVRQLEKAQAVAIFLCKEVLNNMDGLKTLLSIKK